MSAVISNIKIRGLDPRKKTIFDKAEGQEIPRVEYYNITGISGVHREAVFNYSVNGGDTQSGRMSMQIPTGTEEECRDAIIAEITAIVDPVVEQPE